MTRSVRWLGGICGMARHTTRSSRFDAHVPRARCAQGKGESLVDLLEALHVASTWLAQCQVPQLLLCKAWNNAAATPCPSFALLAATRVCIVNQTKPRSVAWTCAFLV